MTKKPTVTFYYAITSRYSYLASTQIEKLELETGCEVSWIPVDGWELRSISSSEPFKSEPVSGQYRSPYREQDLQNWAEFYGVPYHEPPDQDGKIWWTGMDVAASRLIVRAAVAGKRMGQCAAVSRALFKVMFGTDLWPVDEAACIAAATEVGLDKDEFCAMLHDPQTESDLSGYAHEALRLGAFGVPTFVYEGNLFWGNDRIVLLKHRIAKD